MGLFSRFRKGPTHDRISTDLGPLLVQVAVRECGTLQDVWGRRLDDRTQVALLAEFVIILVTIADRLAFGTFGDPTRSQIMNPVLDTVRDCFANQSHFGTTRQDRIVWFERLFADRSRKLAACNRIMGQEQDELVFTAARHLADTFLDEIPEPEVPGAVLETATVLTTTVFALMTTPTFKALCEKV
jgi:hypothetical protein